MGRVGLSFDCREGFLQRPQAAAVIGAENNTFSSQRVDQKTKSPRIRARAVDEEMVEENLRVALHAFWPFGRSFLGPLDK